VATVGELKIGMSIDAAPFAAEALARLFREECPGTVTDDDGREIYVEPVICPPRLLVVGGGHVGQAVVKLGVELGFDITVVEDREEYAHSSLFPDEVETRWGDIKPLVAEFPQDKDTYIVLVSKGHRPDAEALEGCIRGNSAYIGMIGSKRKIRFLKKHFLEEGLATEAEWNRVATPIGFDIGAVTVPEIAVSIAAQLVAARRRKTTTARSLQEMLAQ